eukprot:CAMPEP_0194043292 /NCGR_PEP_ID=MMETSP0009_2-20130614/14957_1 /TAXON_ID=210454 /ORGANISM="Grammatophora oceanica, Strain CCMP 410" /LENGTH=944 /DNA_ID=CAMNT_0038687459 /DNA_START=167 /DNA_END=3001 /DNA_ORIENTATION=-
MSSRYFHGEEMEENIDSLMESDKAARKTWTRMVVEKYLQNYNWYFPGKSRRNGPSLEKAWAYYEHYAMARYYVADDGRPLPGKPRAEPGDSKPSELYSPITTAESNLNEWGIGVALYFATLRAVAILLILTGLINIPNILFYSGDNYSPEGRDEVSFTLQGSAVCTQFQWVVCTTCQSSQWDDSNAEKRRFAFGLAPDGTNTTLVQQSDCNGAELRYGIVNYASLIFLLIALLALALYQRKREVLFDIGKQTATDYSVVVRNPPPDAYDVDRWCEFFSQFAEKQVSVVTVALNNHMLLRKMITRRVLRASLRRQLSKGIDIDNEDEVRTAVAEVLREQEGEEGCISGCISKLLNCTIMPILHFFNWFLPPDLCVDKIFKTTNEIKELQQEKYDVVAVYVTFETEAGQRNCLTAFSTSKVNLWRNNTDAVPPSTVFEGRVLEVVEPEEPSSVRWLDLHVGFKTKFIQRLLNFVITLGLVALAGYLVSLCRYRVGPQLSAPITTVFNSIIPVIVKLLLLIENHNDEGSRQQSLYLKITLFRWVNTAILTRIVTPFTGTIGGVDTDVLPTISAILWSELWLSPALRILDIMGNLKKHVLGPRAKTQESMNLWYQGTVYNLGERYTDFTKVMFLCFFYSALFPGSFFFCGAILLMQYYVDKYCLMRIWSTAPFIGSQLAVFSRRYFFSLALLAFAVVAAYSWAQFPYDNVCFGSDTGFAATYTDVQNLHWEAPEGFADGVVPVSKDENVLFCDQNWRAMDGLGFPPVPSVLQTGDLRWMTDSQETLSRLYGWSSMVALIAFVVLVFGGTIVSLFVGLYRGNYTPDGEDQHIDFSSEEISGYVPQFKVGAFQYPCIAADVDDFDKSLIDFQDPKDPQYDTHNLIFDMPYKGMKRPKVETEGRTARDGDMEPSSGRPPIFAICKSWNAHGLEKIEEEDGNDLEDDGELET